MRLLDTDVLIDIQRRYQPALDWFSTLAELPGIPGFVAMELYQDAPDTKRVREVDQLIAPLAIFWPSARDCHKALTDFRTLHLSHGIGLLDALIGATAVGHHATLVTFNLRHFRPFTDLTTDQPYSK